MQVAREISYRILSRLPSPLSNVNAFLAPSVHLFFFFLSFCRSILSPRSRLVQKRAYAPRIAPAFIARGGEDQRTNIRIFEFLPLSIVPPRTHPLRYITLHYNILHYTTLYYIILHYVMLRYSTLYYTITLYYIITLHYVMLRYTTLHYTIL